MYEAPSAAIITESSISFWCIPPVRIRLVGIVAISQLYYWHNAVGGEDPLTQRTVTEWYGKIEDAERFPDLEYWQSKDDAARFAAVWELVIEAHLIKGEDLRGARLQRSVESLQRREG
jgi:hypothetical protein